jgi:DNA polymerase III epsilon subunit-like protein
MSGIRGMHVDALPVAVVDVETTGLHPAGDRIIEIAIVRTDPGAQARVVLETLVHPQRRVSATEIHGITDAHVRGAPTFGDITPLVEEALSGAVFASYNVYFDAKFIGAELQRAGIAAFPPHVCLMYLRPMLGLGGRCSLADACRHHGVPHLGAHMAADDAVASAGLWLKYLSHMEALELRTFDDLASVLTLKSVDHVRSSR